MATKYGVGTSYNVGVWDPEFGWLDPGKSINSWSISQLTFDPKGTMWCVGKLGNVGVYLNNQWDDPINYDSRYTNINTAAPNPITQIYWDSQLQLWCISDSKVYFWSNGQWQDPMGTYGDMNSWELLQILNPGAEGLLWCVGQLGNVGYWNTFGDQNSEWADPASLGYTDISAWSIQQLLIPPANVSSSATYWAVGAAGNIGMYTRGQQWVDHGLMGGWSLRWLTWSPD
jgi:hypothetical protein